VRLCVGFDRTILPQNTRFRYESRLFIFAVHKEGAHSLHPQVHLLIIGKWFQDKKAQKVGNSNVITLDGGIIVIDPSNFFNISNSFEKAAKKTLFQKLVTVRE
jgi:hypothetical protein